MMNKFSRDQAWEIHFIPAVVAISLPLTVPLFTM
jgi:hypothetical protein